MPVQRPKRKLNRRAAVVVAGTLAGAGLGGYGMHRLEQRSENILRKERPRQYEFRKKYGDSLAKRVEKGISRSSAVGVGGAAGFGVAHGALAAADALRRRREIKRRLQKK